ncbi:MAG: hypothetical protein M1275_00940 [Patescibacteria group bacterium]|nr:hypothetical protein [Patescibacteria group bacterium]
MGIESWFSWGRSPEAGQEDKKRKEAPLASSFDSFHVVEKAEEEGGQINEPDSKVVEMPPRSRPEETVEKKKAA